jgi:regulator of nucleoside diphosphate kinase
MTSVGPLPRVVVTTIDRRRLMEVLRSWAVQPYDVLSAQLAAELARARVVAPRAVPPAVVTMRSRVRARDADGSLRAVTLVYPGEEDALLGRVSVLEPLGAALLGLAEGESIAWRSLDGRPRRATVLEVLYQPEAHGYDLEPE